MRSISSFWSTSDTFRIPLALSSKSASENMRSISFLERRPLSLAMVISWLLPEAWSTADTFRIPSSFSSNSASETMGSISSLERRPLSLVVLGVEPFVGLSERLLHIKQKICDAKASGGFISAPKCAEPFRGVRCCVAFLPLY